MYCIDNKIEFKKQKLIGLIIDLSGNEKKVGEKVKEVKKKEGWFGIFNL